MSFILIVFRSTFLLFLVVAHLHKTSIAYRPFSKRYINKYIKIRVSKSTQTHPHSENVKAEIVTFYEFTGMLTPNLTTRRAMGVMYIFDDYDIFRLLEEIREVYAAGNHGWR